MTPPELVRAAGEVGHGEVGHGEAGYDSFGCVKRSPAHRTGQSARWRESEDAAGTPTPASQADVDRVGNGRDAARRGPIGCGRPRPGERADSGGDVVTGETINRQLQTATEIVRAELSPELWVTEINPLDGGMVSHVHEWKLSGPPHAIVAKYSNRPGYEELRNEFETLQWYRRHTEFPVPRPIALVDEPVGRFKGTCVLMERIYGRHFGRCRLTPEGRKHLQVRLAEHVAALHGFTRQTYGSALREGTSTRWLDRFAPDFEREFFAVRGQLSRGAQRVVHQLSRKLDRWIPCEEKPTLLHGDLWSNNILVDDSNPNFPELRAFIDATATYSDREYELAYLRCFETVDENFFRTYTRHHAIASGFTVRCQIYWLRTMMLHVRYFGPQYLPPCEKLVQELAMLI